MGFLLRKQKGLIFTGIARLAIISFVASIAFAFIDSIWAVYLDSFVNSASIVGFISAGLTVVSFISYFYFIPLIEKSSKSKIYFYSMIGFFIAYVLFAINKNFYFVIVLAFIATILHTLRLTSFGIIVSDKSSERNLSRNEGLMYTFANVAWVVGPLIAGWISEYYGINLVFSLSAIFIFIALFLFKISRVDDVNIKPKADESMIKNFISFFKDKERRIAYLLGGGVNFWWALIYIFIPIFIIRQGLGIRWVGYFLFAVAVPLVAFGYVFSKLAGTVGFRKIFKIGFLIPAILVFICFFVSNPYIILGLLVFASIGLAMLEATTEAYFFDILGNKKNRTKFYGPYNTTIDVNYFVGKLLSAVILLFLPFKFLFLFFAIMMFSFFLLCFKIKNVIEGRR